MGKGDTCASQNAKKEELTKQFREKRREPCTCDAVYAALPSRSDGQIVSQKRRVDGTEGW